MSFFDQLKNEYSGGGGSVNISPVQCIEFGDPIIQWTICLDSSSNLVINKTNTEAAPALIIQDLNDVNTTDPLLQVNRTSSSTNNATIIYVADEAPTCVFIDGMVNENHGPLTACAIVMRANNSQIEEANLRGRGIFLTSVTPPVDPPNQTIGNAWWAGVPYGGTINNSNLYTLGASGEDTGATVGTMTGNPSFGNTAGAYVRKQHVFVASPVGNVGITVNCVDTDISPAGNITDLATSNVKLTVGGANLNDPTNPATYTDPDPAVPTFTSTPAFNHIHRSGLVNRDNVGDPPVFMDQPSTSGISFGTIVAKRFELPFTGPFLPILPAHAIVGGIVIMPAGLLLNNLITIDTAANILNAIPSGARESSSGDPIIGTTFEFVYINNSPRILTLDNTGSNVAFLNATPPAFDNFSASRADSRSSTQTIRLLMVCTGTSPAAFEAYRV